MPITGSFGSVTGLFVGRQSLPMIFQSESSECGLACLAMISGYHGKDVGIAHLREVYRLSGTGASVKHLMTAAQRVGLQCRPLKIELPDLPQLELPVILHWDLDHFVVLKAVSSRDVTIHDPAVGVRKYRLEEVGVHITGIGIEVRKSVDFTPESVQENFSLKQLFQPGKGFYKVVVQVFTMSVLMQLLAILTPLYMQLVIDQGLSLQDRDLVLLLAALFLIVTMAKTIVGYFRSIILLQFSNQFGFQLAENTFAHLIRLPLQYFEKREMGDVVSRFSSLENIKQLVTQEMITVVVDGVFSLFTLILLYLYNPFLCVIALGAITLLCVVRALSIANEKILRQEALVAGAKQQTVFMENIRSISTTKLNSIERERELDWLSNYTSFINSGYHLGKFQLSVSTAQGLIFGLDHIITIYFGALLVFEQSLTIGQLMSFVFLKQHFISSVTAMIPKLAELKLMKLELERLGDITLQKKDVDNNACSLLALSPRPSVNVKNLSFSYGENQPNVVRNVNIDLLEGESLGIWGNSGCGKTTFLKLLLGVEKPTSGSVLFGGQPLKNLSADERRGYLAAITHGETLLTGSLAYNINLGLEAFDEKKLMRVCEQTGADKVIQDLPMGFSTQISEMGVLFSAGQVQRILLARALYQQPKVLVLDESLSHLGEDTGLELLQRIAELNVTLIVVSHNQTLINATDKQLLLGGEELAISA